MNSEQIEELFESANQNKYSYVLMLPLGDAVLEQHIENWLAERVNLVKTSVYAPGYGHMFRTLDYVLCSVCFKMRLDTTKQVFVNIHTMVGI